MNRFLALLSVVALVTIATVSWPASDASAQFPVYAANCNGGGYNQAYDRYNQAFSEPLPMMPADCSGYIPNYTPRANYPQPMQFGYYRVYQPPRYVQPAYRAPAYNYNYYRPAYGYGSWGGTSGYSVPMQGRCVGGICY